MKSTVPKVSSGPDRIKNICETWIGLRRIGIPARILQLGLIIDGKRAALSSVVFRGPDSYQIDDGLNAWNLDAESLDVPALEFAIENFGETVFAARWFDQDEEKFL